MIRHNSGAAARRIAVIQAPRPADRRLGTLRAVRAYDWTITPPLVTLSDEPQSTADQWIAQRIQQQGLSADLTPGTVSYTPRNDQAPLQIGRWNTWNGPCGSTPPNTVTPQPGALTPQAIAQAAAAGNSPTSQWILLAAVLGAAASGLYLVKGGR
jgi:hypothetical protein